MARLGSLRLRIPRDLRRTHARARSVAVGTVGPGKRQEQRERFEKLRHLIADLALGLAHRSIVGSSIELTLERFRGELAALETGVSGLHVRLAAEHRHLRVRIAEAQE